MIVELKDNKSIIMYELSDEIPQRYLHDIIEEVIQYLDNHLWGGVPEFSKRAVLPLIATYLDSKKNARCGKKNTIEAVIND